ncbi:MAG: hypothetical protein IJF78_10150 [Clostridia bacterium]|nr:hypothetical protein [Clostridia bacterium]
MLFVRILISLIIIITAIFLNARWKMMQGSEKYCGGFLRVCIGLPALIGLYGYMTENGKMKTICGIIVLLLLVYPFIRLLKDRCYPVRYTLMALFASIGTWGRLALITSIIGIPFNRLIDSLVSGAVYEYFKHYSGTYSASDNVPEPEDDIAAGLMKIGEVWEEEKRKQEREIEENNKPKVEVTRRNGFFINNLTVNSDGTMYWDPDDGEWKKISDLEEK